MSIEYERMREMARNINAHLQRVEAQVALISQKLGLPYEVATQAVAPEVVALVQAGKQLEAIRKYRELTGADLETARQVIDQV